MSRAVTRVFVVGPPRSGTTWIAQTLGRAEDASYVHEPDGDHQVYALKVKRGGPRHVEIIGDDAPPGYDALWAAAFAGGRHDRSLRGRLAERLFDGTTRQARTAARTGRATSLRVRLAVALARPSVAETTPQAVVVKSVQSCLAVEWIAARFEPAVVVVERNPLNVLASWDELGHGVDADEYRHLGDVARARWGIDLPGPDAPRIARQAAFFGVLRGALSETAARHPTWTRVCHDELLSDSEEKMRRLCEEVGLEFSEASAAYLRASDQPGKGFATRRVTSELADRWRNSLSPEQVGDALDTLRRFPPALGLLDAVGEVT